MNTTASAGAAVLARWERFVAALAPARRDLVRGEDVIAAVIDRTILADELGAGWSPSAGETRRLVDADTAFRAGIPPVLARTGTGPELDEAAWWHGIGQAAQRAAQGMEGPG